jgi:YVTN family beta-propeller protein
MLRWIVLGALGLAAAVAALLWWRQSASAGIRVFVSNYRSDTVSVVDPELGREITAIRIDKGPMGLALRPGGTPQVAVANSTSNQVTLIDPDRLTVAGTIPVGKGPEYVAFSPDGAVLYATSPYDQTLNAFDMAQQRPAGDPIALGRRPNGLAVAPDGRRVYVLLKDVQGEAVAIDAASRAIVGRVGVGKQPTGIALSGDGTRLLAASFDDSTITVIDTETLAVVSTISAPTGLGLIAHPSQPLVFSLASFDDQIAVVDFATGQVAATFDVGQWPTYGAISPDGRRLYVPNEDSDNLAVIDAETHAVMVRIAVGDEPAHAVVVPAP